MTYGIGYVWGMPSLPPLSSALLTRIISVLSDASRTDRKKNKSDFVEGKSLSVESCLATKNV